MFTVLYDFMPDWLKTTLGIFVKIIPDKIY